MNASIHDRFEERYARKLWEMLPAVYRTADEDAQSGTGTLRAFVQLIARVEEFGTFRAMCYDYEELAQWIDDHRDSATCRSELEEAQTLLDSLMGEITDILNASRGSLYAGHTLSASENRKDPAGWFCR